MPRLLLIVPRCRCRPCGVRTSLATQTILHPSQETCPLPFKCIQESMVLELYPVLQPITEVSNCQHGLSSSRDMLLASCRVINSSSDPSDPSESFSGEPSCVSKLSGWFEGLRLNLLDQCCSWIMVSEMDGTKMARYDFV